VLIFPAFQQEAFMGGRGLQLPFVGLITA